MTSSPVEFEKQEKTAQLKWVAFIMSFFLIQAVIWAVAITVTATDQSHAVVADYDEKALKWDEEKALIVSSEKLGWNAELDIAASGDIQGYRSLTLTLTDSQDQPVEDVAIEVKAFHRARAAEPQEVVFSKMSAGKYAGRVRVLNAGWWQFNGVAKKGDQTYLIKERQFLKAGR